MLKFLYVLLLPGSLAAQLLDGTGSDRITDLAVTPMHTVVCGYQTDAAQLNGTAVATFGNDDATLTLTDETGTVLHHLVLGGALDDQSEGITTDTDGNIYWTGTYRGTATLGSLTLTDPTNQKAVFVLKISPAAEVLWVQTIRGDGFKILEELAWHPDGGLVAVGSFSETILLDNGDTHTANAARDALLLRFDAPTGALLETAQLGDAGTFNTRSVVATPDGTYHFAGDFNGTAILDNQTVQTGTGGTDVFYATHTPGAGIDHLAALSGNQSALLSEIVADPAGNVYLGGAFFGTLHTEDGFSIGTTSFNNDGWLLRRNADGSTAWLTALGGGAAETIRALAFDQGRLFAGGIFSESFTANGLQFSPAGGTTTGYVARFDPLTGQPERLERFGSAELTFVFALAAAEGAPPVVGGQFSGTLNIGGQSFGPALGFAGFWRHLDDPLVPTTTVPRRDFQIFPNPAETVLFFSESTDYVLFDATGRQFRAGTGRRVSVGALPSGVYVLRTPFGAQRFVRR